MHGNVNKSLRRHAKLNHSSVGGYGHMGRRASKVTTGMRFKEARPEPMKVTLADFVGTSHQEGPAG